jgi:hypothetical protein
LIAIFNKSDKNINIPIAPIPNFDDNDLKMLHDDNKRLNELEKQVKEINIKINVEIADTFKKIFALLDKKANLDDVYNLKEELMSKICNY